MKIQRHSGPQERIDLSFNFPSLEPPEAPKHVSADTVVEEAVQPIDRIFLSVAAHHDTLAPDMLVRTIYPRYLDQASTPAADGLTLRAFRDGTPYGGEDLFVADTPNLAARCITRRQDPRHVPERTPDRRRRPDVPVSARLACAMARRRQCDGSPDGAIARAGRIMAGGARRRPAGSRRCGERLAGQAQPCSTRSSSRIAIWNWNERSSSSSSTNSTPMNSSPI